MGRFFRCNMFFTSFLPLWVSIIVSDIWSIVANFITYVAGIEPFPMTYKQILNIFVPLLLRNKIESISVIVLSICIIISTCHINHVIRAEQNSNNKNKGTIIRARRANKLTSEFLLAYILPMLAFDFSCLKSIVLFLIYFFVLCFLCIRNSNVYTNIFLEMKDYRMYNCDIECCVMGHTHLYTDSLIISKKDLTHPLPLGIEYFDFENYIYIEIGE